MKVAHIYELTNEGWVEERVLVTADTFAHLITGFVLEGYAVQGHHDTETGIVATKNSTHEVFRITLES